jgi:acetate kinase
MKKEDLKEFLKNRTELFSSFEAAALDTIVDQGRVVSFEPDEAIIEFGEEGRFVGILLEGEAVASVTDESGRQEKLGSIKPGDIFGETALMTGRKTAADVIGVTRCSAMLISQSLFMSKIMIHPKAIQVLARILTERSVMAAYIEDRLGTAEKVAGRSRDPFGFSLASEAPHKILVINCGSSSLKYRLFDTDNAAISVTGSIERIGSAGGAQGDAQNAVHRFDNAGNKESENIVCADHTEAFASMIDMLSKHRQIVAASDITAVGHRVVHGGEKFTHATLITNEVIGEIEALGKLAPLHNKVNASGIRLAMQAFPHAHHVAVFDTSFHHTLPSYAYLYGLPFEYYEQMGIRRYGFHGTSHFYVSLKAAQFLKRSYNSLEIITCHLGNGSSVCAVDHGRSVDTSMGMTPSAGLLMGTRSGDVDPGVWPFVMDKEKLDAKSLDTLINKKSGLLGMSGLSNDMREVMAAADKGHSRALLAIKTYCYQIRKYLGAYTAAMQGLDVVVFTGGIGENSPEVRSLACQGLDCMGIEIDENKNREAVHRDEPSEISPDDAKIRVLVVPTNEELMIARETLGAVERHSRDVDLSSAAGREIPIEVSAHHVHLSRADVDALFGAGYSLTPTEPLSQPGQFACKETVNLVGPKGRVERVRVLGPERSRSQVEISMTEQFKLGVHPPIRESSDLDGTPGLTLEGPLGNVSLKQGVICAMRHIHMAPEDALRLGLRDRYIVRVVVQGDRELTFGDVAVRVSPNFKLAMHIDTDEANAANLQTGAVGVVEGIQSRGR